MKQLPKIAALAALCLATTFHANAQEEAPLTGPAAAEKQKKWFSVNNDDIRYQFTVDLGKGEFMVLKFRRLSDWTSRQDFLNVFSAADKVMAAYKDSLQPQRTQLMDIHVPANRKHIISRFTHQDEPGSMMTIGDNGASALKLGMDTLRVKEETRTGKVVRTLQCIFVLKELGNYNNYTRDEAWKDKTATLIDSVVNEHRAKWGKSQDAARHGLDVSYNPSKNTSRVSESWQVRNDKLVIEGGVGASLVRNTLCPNIEAGIGIYLGRNTGSNTFIRLSVNEFFRFTEQSPNKFKGYATGFVNLELGSAANHQVNPGSPFYRTSIGFGYKLLNKKEEERDPTMDKQMYRLFFTYAVNKWLVLTPEIVSNFRKGDRSNAWWGLSLNLKLF